MATQAPFIPSESNSTAGEVSAYRHLQAVLDAASELSIIATDPEGLITIFNRGAEKMLGYTSGEMIGKQTPMLLHLQSELEQYGIELSRKLGREISGFRVFVENSRLSGEGKREWTYVRMDGSHLQVNLTITIIRNEQNAITGYLAIAENLTERKEAEQERERLSQDLQHAHRMESIGRLASGVSHDLNNLLTPILGYAEMLRTACASDERLLKRVHGILEAAGKARELNRQLLAFSRKQVLEMKTIDLNQVLSAFSTLLNHTIRQDITIIQKLDPRLGSIQADQTQIEQVIMNLIINAQDAMPNGGSLVIETQNVSLSRSPKQASDLKPGPYVVLKMTDSGSGMSPEIVSHIFEPFFTTKAPGMGTGLGLATVFGIVKQHGGHICATSEPGIGSAFTVYFPQVDRPSTPGEDPVQEGSWNLHGNRTILLVEDNTLVREMTCDLLMEHGYTVLVAACAKEAMALMVKYALTVDLMLTDIIMPDMSGTALFETIRPLYPALKVIFMSGYNDNIFVQQVPQANGPHYIHKPFNHDVILKKIDEVFSDRH